jgi:hypothetical protein
MLRSFQWSLIFGSPNQNSVNTYPLPHACFMSHPPHPPWFNYPDNIRWRTQAIKFIIMQFSPWSLFLLGPYILLNTLFSKTLSLCSSSEVRNQVLHPYSTTGKITVLYILIFRFFWYEMGRQKILDWIIEDLYLISWLFVIYGNNWDLAYQNINW